MTETLIFRYIKKKLILCSKFNREITPLLSIRDAYPKLLITRTFVDEYQYEGLRIIDITNWLKNI